MGNTETTALYHKGKEELSERPEDDPLITPTPGVSVYNDARNEFQDPRILEYIKEASQQIQKGLILFIYL